MVGLAPLDPPYTSPFSVLAGMRSIGGPIFPGWLILDLEIGRLVRYIHRCTFVRFGSLTIRLTFNRRCPAGWRCAGMVRKGAGHLLCEAPPRAVAAKGARHIFGHTLSNRADVRGGYCVISRYTASTCSDRFFAADLNRCRITVYSH